MCQGNIVGQGLASEAASVSVIMSGCYYGRSSHPGGECHTLALHQLLTRCSGPPLHLVAL